MRWILAAMMLIGSLALVHEGVKAEDKAAGKEVTLKGKITCAKCELGLEKACATVIVVSKDGKDTVYYFDKAGHKKSHGAVCSESKPGSVTGVVSEEGKKKIVTVKDVKFE